MEFKVIIRENCDAENRDMSTIYKKIRRLFFFGWFQSGFLMESLQLQRSEEAVRRSEVKLAADLRSVCCNRVVVV